MNHYVNQYKQTEVTTASREQILIMLYDGAIKFLYKAKLGFETNNIEEIHNNITKAQRIITEFQSTLDMQKGGKFAEEMYALYEYFNNRLFEANIKKRTDYIDEVLKHLTELRDTWKEAINNYKAAGNTFPQIGEDSDIEMEEMPSVGEIDI